MIKIYAGRLQAVQQDVLILLELEEKASPSLPTNEVQLKFYKIIKVDHVWHGGFSIPSVEGTHILPGDFDANTFEPREFYKAQSHLVRALRRKANILRGQADDLFSEANNIMYLDPNNE